MSETPPPVEPGEPVPDDLSAPAPETLAVAPRGGRRGLVIGVGATVLAVAAGAVVWATTTLSGGGTQPDEVVPKSTFAYVKVDLDPAANQKLAARSFFAKFPSLKDKVGSGDADNVFDDLLAEVVDDETLDYRTDVQPWFDKRAAVAAFFEGSKSHVVAALRSKDDAKAKASLDKAVARAGDGTTYRLTKGYALVGDKDAVAAAVQLTESSSLGDNTTYRDDVDRLSGDQIAVGWTDTAKAFSAIKGQLSGAEMIPALVANQVKGRIVAGLHLTGDTAEVQGLILGADLPKVDDTTSHDLLTGLPANTAVAFGANGLGKAIADQSAGLPLDRLAGDYLEATGLSLTGDLLPLLGTQTVLAAAPFSGLEDLQAGLVSKVADAEKAAKTAAKIQAALGAFGIPAKADVTGDTFVVGMPESWADSIAKGGGGLGAKPGFTKAMGDLSGVTGAFYADVSALGPLAPFDGVPAGTTFGAVSGVRDGSAFFRLRLVVG